MQATIDEYGDMTIYAHGPTDSDALAKWGKEWQERRAELSMQFDDASLPRLLIKPRTDSLADKLGGKNWKEDFQDGFRTVQPE
jgi:hypothetical protein